MNPRLIALGMTIAIIFLIAIGELAIFTYLPTKGGAPPEWMAVPAPPGVARRHPLLGVVKSDHGAQHAIDDGPGCRRLQVPMTLRDLLTQWTYQHTSEAELQAGVQHVLDSAGITYTREAVLGPADRVDFLLGSTALEVKVDGSLSSVTRQLHRYAQLESITEVILLTSRRKHCRLPPEMNGKPISVIWVSPL